MRMRGPSILISFSACKTFVRAIHHFRLRHLLPHTLRLLTFWPMAWAQSVLADVPPPPRTTLLESLSPVDRTKVVMTLLGLVLLGLTLLVMVWWSGRYLRRIVRQPLRPLADREYDWAKKPLVPKPGSPEPPPTEPV